MTAELPGRLSLAAQIAEIKRELAQRAITYPRLVSTRKLTQAEADYRNLALGSVLRTLQWLQRHERGVREAVAAEQAARASTLRQAQGEGSETS